MDVAGWYYEFYVMKVVRVTEDVHQRLANLGKIGDTYNDVIERLLNEYEDYTDMIEAEEEIDKGLIKSYSNLDDFKEDIKNDVPFEQDDK